MATHEDAEKIADKGLAAWEGGDFASAEELWHQAANLGSARAMVNLGRNRIDDGDLDGAAAWFVAAVDAGSAEAAIWMGRMAFDRGDEEERQAWRWKAAELGDIPMMMWLAHNTEDPDPNESFNVVLMQRTAEAGSHAASALLCVRAMERGNHAECISWGERAMESKDEEENPAQLARLHAVLGAAYRLMDRPADALPHYEAALALAPDAVEADHEDIEDLKWKINDTSPFGD